MKVKIVQALLQGNDTIANVLREEFKKKGIFVFNVISSPGAGKTTLLQNFVKIVNGKLNVGVIVGDIEDTVDAQRIESSGAKTIQLNTKGACHLDAGMVKNALSDFELEKLDLLIIENVGNLVCPSDFDLGEDMKIVILSTTEGDDKPKKYPGTFFKSDVVIFNKMDLLSFTNFSVEKAKSDILTINPRVKIFEVSANKIETLYDFANFIIDKVRWKKSLVS
ncbi:MAG: hydrogenase nickel incorporation protein HypB [Proteobacteria bacterium]|nr:hydrogenase nickel incorporation protein HypB [Pseudomonadota bacterium]